MKPDFWPDGASIEIVGDCSYRCGYCEGLLRAKYKLDNGESIDGTHKSITDFD